MSKHSKAVSPVTATAPATADKATVIVPTDEQIAEYLAKQVAAPSKFDWKLYAPVDSRPIDMHSIPADKLRFKSTQLPAKKWISNAHLARGFI